MYPRIAIYLLFLLYAILGACKGKDQEPQGTSICASANFEYTDDFKVNGSTTTSGPVHLDFQQAPYFAKFTSVFNEAVAWTITITGQTSGAVKTYSGTGNEIEIDWYGNADGNIWFVTGETCIVSLQPSCKSAVILSVVIDQKSTFQQFGYLVMDSDAKLADFVYSNPPPTRNVDTALTEASPQGGKCRKLYAPTGHSGWYIGGVGHTANNLSAFVGNISADSVYANIYLKGIRNTVATLIIKENIGGTNYMFTHNFVINWSGWRMVSVRLSDMSIAVPAQISSIDVQVGPNSYNVETECYIDFVILTKGKPFSGAN